MIRYIQTLTERKPADISQESTECVAFAALTEGLTMRSIKLICIAIFLLVLGCFMCLFKGLGLVAGVTTMAASLILFIRGAWVNDIADASASYPDEVQNNLDSIKKLCSAAYLLPLGCIVSMVGIIGVAIGIALIFAAFVLFVKGLYARFTYESPSDHDTRK